MPAFSASFPSVQGGYLQPSLSSNSCPPPGLRREHRTVLTARQEASDNTRWSSVCLLLTARSSVAALCTHGQDSDVGILRDGCESWGSVEGEENLETSLGHVATTPCVVDDGESLKPGFLVCSVKIV